MTNFFILLWMYFGDYECGRAVTWRINYLGDAKFSRTKIRVIPAQLADRPVLGR